MNTNNFSGGPAFKGLLMGGLVVGAMGLALSGQGSNYGKWVASDPAANQGPATDPAPNGRNAEPGGDSSGSSGGLGGQGGEGGAGNEAATPSIAGVARAMLPPNVTPGWKIRVCSEKTKAANINFKISSEDKPATGSMPPGGSGGSGGVGSTGGSGSAADNTGAQPAESQSQSGEGGTGMHQTAMWSQGEPTEIAFPAEFKDAHKIKLEATPGEKNKEASVCVIYNDHVAKKLKFDDKETSTVKSTETGECGC
ncbi:MAG TPA: hypothetical protein VJ385_11035 [Fibrobacteria bacterium]|nr:hypothetical protein [Fibrobacteria bacterium]